MVVVAQAAEKAEAKNPSANVVSAAAVGRKKVDQQVVVAVAKKAMVAKAVVHKKADINF
ncbi:hypothetical protein D3C87_1685650 [compost metagenome]